MMPMLTPYRIMIADDSALFREGLKKILLENADMRIVGEAGDGIELLNLLDQLAMNALHPHLVIADISMPNLSGIEATRRIKMAYPEMKVLILSMHKEMEYVRHAMTAGAQGYVTKADANGELLSAIETVRQGGVFISSLLARKGNI
jgi:DNA-binding NarL/FixJ family response regulator